MSQVNLSTFSDQELEDAWQGKSSLIQQKCMKYYSMEKGIEADNLYKEITQVQQEQETIQNEITRRHTTPARPEIVIPDPLPKFVIVTDHDGIEYAETFYPDKKCECGIMGAYTLDLDPIVACCYKHLVEGWKNVRIDFDRRSQS